MNTARALRRKRSRKVWKVLKKHWLGGGYVRADAVAELVSQGVACKHGDGTVTVADGLVSLTPCPPWGF